MTKKKSLLILLLAGAIACADAVALTGCGEGGDDGGTDTPACEHQNAIHKTPSAGDCTTNGNAEYWFCGDCGKYFSDGNFENETTLEAVTVIAGHKFGAWIEEEPATCAETGIKAHKDCSVCLEHFDAQGVKIDDLTIPATGAHESTDVYVYNAEKKVYEIFCKNDCGHVISSKPANGSEEFPYHISNMEQWLAFAKSHSTATAVKSTNHYKVDCDLDFSNVEGSEKVNVYDFSGTIDFCGHKVSGLTTSNTTTAAYWVNGLFEVVHDATIKNIDFEASFFNRNGHITHLVSVVLAGENVIEGATVRGSAQYKESNASALVYMIFSNVKVNLTNDANPAKALNAAYEGAFDPNIALKMKDCNSYVDINNEGGYTGVFLGQAISQSGAGVTLEFDNCVNYGTVIGKGQTSLLIANQSNDIKSLTVKNCVNKGNMYGGSAVYPVIGNSANSADFNTANTENVTNEGVMEKLTVGTLEVDGGNFVLDANAVKAELSFVYTAAVYNAEHTKIDLWGTAGTTVNVTGKDSVKALTFINAKSLTGKDYAVNSDGMYTTNDGLHYVFGVNEADWISGAELTAPVKVYYTVYDSNDNVLSVSVYTYGA